MSGRVAISEAIGAILALGRTVDGVYYLPDGTLDRKTYLACDRALQALGGKWDRRVKGHTVPPNFPIRLADALCDGSAVDADKAAGFFATPRPVADLVWGLAEVEPTHHLLEPSAGEGDLLIPLFEAGSVASLTLIESDFVRYQSLCDSFPGARAVLGMDFLEFRPDVRFDRILMNPPWGKGREYDHLDHALDLLAPGGRAVAVLPDGMRYREHNGALWLRSRLSNPPFETTLHDLPDDSFRASGTNVKSCIAVVNRRKGP